MLSGHSRPITFALLALAFFASCANTEERSGPATPSAAVPEEGELAAPAVAGGTGPATSQTATKAGQERTQAGQERLATLQAQRRELLIQTALRNARALKAEGRLEEAETELLRAREVDPDRPEVVQMLNEVQALLGRRVGEVQTFAEQMARLAEIRHQKARADALERIEAARKAMEDGDHGTAVQLLRQVRIQIEAGPFIDWGDLAERAGALLRQAEEERDRREAALREQAEREAFMRLRAEEEVRLARKRDTVRRLMGRAVRAFEERDFLLSRQLCDEILKVDPTNEQALQLHSAAEKGLRDSRRDDYLRQRAEDMRRWVESNEELKIPYTDILTPPEAEHWDRLDQIRRVHRHPTGAELLDEASRTLDEQLRTLSVGRLSYTHDTGDFEQVVRDLATITNLPILTTPEAREQIIMDAITVVLTLDHPVTVRNYLDIITTRFTDKLGWFLRDGVIFIGTRAQALGAPAVRVHDIHDLVFGITNFAGPRIQEIPVDTGLPFDMDVPRTGGEVGEAFKFIDPDQLVNAIKDTIARETWDEPGFRCDAIHGNLLVIHTPEIHAQIAQFLDDLRRFHSAVVSIESKFLSVSQNWLQQFGVDFRGLGGAGNQGTVAQLDALTSGLIDNASRGLDNAGTGDEAAPPTAGFFFNDGRDGDIRARSENYFTTPLGRILSPTGGATVGITILDKTELNVLIRAVEKSAQVQEVNSQRLTVMNNQRANISVINLTSYIQDFNVEVAQAAFIADPQVNVIQDGIVLDVRPVISYDRRYITLDLQPTVAELIRPIPTFTTSLAGATLPVTLQLPQMVIRSAATTVKVPDGGSVLIGGLREILNHERRAEIPWLARLPVVSFLFKEEGIVDENRSLMVLVRAQITDVKEAMARRTARR